MVSISVTTNIKELSKKLDAFAYKQLPFATATALTALVRIVEKAEQQAIGSVFDRPTPFTVNSVGVKPARKDNPTAEVFVKDIAASYLMPYEVGGVNKLNSQALLKPVNQPTNQYGNLPRNKIAQLKANPNVFVGSITFKKTGKTISGVWKRNAVPAGARSHGGGVYGTRGKHNVIDGVHTTLTLLVRFEDAHPIKQHLDYRKHAEMLVRTNFNREMGKALAHALATAR